MRVSATQFPSAAALLLLLPGAAAAQGWIEPPPDVPSHHVVRLETEVRVRVEGAVAEVEVTEWFENRGERVAEGTYLYPLPGEAVFASFSLWQGDQELRGEVMDAEEARAIYESIVRRRLDPALIELAGTGLLRARVFPIEPGDRRKVTLRFTQVLERSGDALQFRYAAGLAGGTLLPQPLEPRPLLPAQDGGRRDRDEPHHGRREHEGAPLSLEMVIEDGRAFGDPFSPTHELEHRRQGGRLILEAEGALRGRLSVFLPLAREGVGLTLATHRPPGDDGYFMLTLTPGTSEASVEPRDLTIVLDVSGSMSGEKMEQARAAVPGLLATLSPRDRFRVLAFSSRVRPQSEDWQPARGEALDDARAWVDRLQADGGTNISGALEEAVRLESPAGRLPLIVFVTDGRPSVGEQDPRRIADRVEQGRGRARVFAFGVGHDVDTHLLDALSAAARGTTTYVEPGESIARALELLGAKIRHPVLTDLALGDAAVRLSEVYPVTLPDLFAGEALVLFGRYQGSRPSTQLSLTGRRSGRSESYRVTGDFPRVREGNEFLPRLWASRKIGHLSRQVRLEGASSELVEEIRETALRYGLPSDYTSYLVREPEALAHGGPVFPATGAARDFGGDAVAAAPPPAQARAGAEAVRSAANAARMREVRTEADVARMQAVAEERGAGAAPNGGRAVSGRLFVSKGGVWTEARADGSGRAAPPVVSVKLYSQAYFELLRVLPELVPLALSLERVEVRGEAVTLRLDATGKETLSASELRTLASDFKGPPSTRASDRDRP